MGGESKKDIVEAAPVEARGGSVADPDPQALGDPATKIIACLSIESLSRVKDLVERTLA